MDNYRKRRWITKETMFSPWRELPGQHTAQEIWAMRQKGRFTVAIPMDRLESNLADVLEPKS
jgi:hypothetical protein